MWKGKDLDPYLWLTYLDADPGCPKAYGSGSGTLFFLSAHCLTNVFFQQGDSMGRDPEHLKPSLLNALDWCRTGIWISWIRRHQHFLWVPVHCPSQAIASITSPIIFQSLLIWYRSVRLGCYWNMYAVHFSRLISLSMVQNLSEQRFW